MLRAKVALALVAVVLAPIPAFAETLPPRDECAGTSVLAAFNTTLANIVRKRDSTRLLALLSPDIEVDFGGGHGIGDLKRAWHLDRGAQSPLWAELDEMLKLGCAKDGDSAYLPHMFLRMPEAYDPFSSYVAIGTGIAMRASPDQQGRKIATLNWDIVESADDGTGDMAARDAGWTKVRRGKGPVGYVRTSLLRSSIDYRMHVERVGGRLMITAFIAGD